MITTQLKYLIEPKKGEIKTYEDLQVYGTELELKKELKAKVITLGNRICNLRAQSADAKDKYGMNMEDYRLLVYAIKFGTLKDSPAKALNEVARLF
jgi:hypothetical protein